MVRCALLTTLLLFGCDTEYGVAHRCGPDGECPAGRVWEPIQGYCVRPDPTDGQDGGAVDVGPVDTSGGDSASDARPNVR